jgi:hypothetical protein
MTRQYYSLFFVMGACLLLSLLYCPPFDLLLDDKEIFKYTGMAILRGDVPYRDFFDHKPPMIFFINAAGLIFGPWGLWMINTLLALLSTLLFFNLCRQYRLPFPWLLPLLFNLMLRDNLISLGINMTREYTAFFTIFFFCVLLGKYRYRYFLLGFLGTLIFFTQQDQVLPLIPFLIYAVINDRPLLWTRIAQLAAGALIFTVPLLLYFAVNHSLAYFWEDAFHFNFSVYTTQKKSLGDHFRTVKTMLDAGNYELPFLLALVLGLASLFLQNKKKGLVLASLAALFLTMSPEFMGGRLTTHGASSNFSYYFLPLSASVCLVLFTVFAFTEDKVLAGRKAQLPYVFLLCSSLGYTALQHGSHLERRNSDPVMNTPELPWLRGQKLKDYQLFVFYNDQYTYFYTELKILAPSRWIYQHFWGIYEQWDTDHKLLESIGQDLLRHRTTYVIMDAATIENFSNPANRDWWLSFMNKFYQQVPVTGRAESILWQLKDNP